MAYNNSYKMIKVGDIHMNKLDVGAKIWFSETKKCFKVQASNRFFSICTQPLNKITRLGNNKYRHDKTVLYTVIDWYNQIRGAENLIFGMGAETKKLCEDMLDRLTNAESDISHRNWCKLDIIKFQESKR